MNRAADEGGAAYFALILTMAAIVVIKVNVRSAADRTNFFFRNRPTLATTDRLKLLAIVMFVVSDEELPVLFVERDDLWEFIDLKLLVFRGLGIIVDPLFKRYEFADKAQQERNLFKLLLNNIE